MGDSRASPCCTACPGRSWKRREGRCGQRQGGGDVPRAGQSAELARQGPGPSPSGRRGCSGHTSHGAGGALGTSCRTPPLLPVPIPILVHPTARQRLHPRRPQGHWPLGCSPPDEGGGQQGWLHLAGSGVFLHCWWGDCTSGALQGHRPTCVTNSHTQAGGEKKIKKKGGKKMCREPPRPRAQQGDETLCWAPAVQCQLRLLQRELALLPLLQVQLGEFGRHGLGYSALRRLPNLHAAARPRGVILGPSAIVACQEPERVIFNLRLCQA